MSLREQYDSLHNLVERLEWSAMIKGAGTCPGESHINVPACPICYGFRPGAADSWVPSLRIGHVKDCPILEALEPVDDT